MDKRNLAFDRTNFILLGIGFAIVVIGFILMSGAASTEEAYQAEIFSARRIKLAPVVCFVGFVSMIYAVVRKPKTADDVLAKAEDAGEKAGEAAADAEEALKKVKTSAAEQI